MTGLLLVTMEPAAQHEEEFHDWYDTEHIPERLAVPGILGATRWVCLQGWPRYLALYDLASAAVMDSPEYTAVAGPNVSPWSHRVLPRTIGRRRVVASQVSTEPAGGASRSVAEPATLVVAHYPGAVPPAAIDAMQGLLGLVQMRLFHTVGAAPESWVLAGFDRPQGDLGPFAALAGRGALLVNTYTRYLRTLP